MHVAGIGERLSAHEHLPEWAAVLVIPRQCCPTPEIFRAYKDSGQNFSAPASVPEDLGDRQEFLDFLKRQQNDLELTAIEKLPAIRDVSTALKQTEDVQLVRMSGSGATVFALYPTPESAQRAAELLQSTRPHWWVRACTLNRVVRY